MKKLRRNAVSSVLIILSVVIIGTVVIALVEDWPFVNSLYWACVTITTGKSAKLQIGFVDNGMG